MTDVVLVDAVRTPIGAPGGKLSCMSAPDLGAVTIGALFKNNRLSPRLIDAVIMGHALPAGCGPSTARKAALRAGLPYEVNSTTVSHAGLSGMRAIVMGADLISCGNADVVIAGGYECMSQVPDYRHASDQEKPAERVDGATRDFRASVTSHSDPLQQVETFFRNNGFTREQLEKATADSLERARKATKPGHTNQELVPVKIRDKNGKAHVIRSDEHPRLLQPENFASLEPLFSADSIFTPATIAPMGDGAAALLLMSREKAEALKLPVMARLLASARIAVKPALFAESLWACVHTVTTRAGLNPESIDLFELDDTVAALPLYAAKQSGMAHMRTNIRGSALSLGHPVGCTGARMLVTLAHGLEQENCKSGCACACTTGGEAEAIVLAR